MTRFEPDTLTLAAAQDALAERYDETEAEIGDLQRAISDADEDDDVEAMRDRLKRLRSELDDIDQEGRAVSALLDRYDAEATVTVRGLSASEYAKVENYTWNAAKKVTSGDSVPGTGRLVFAAAGLVDAPFYDGGGDDLDAKLSALGAEPIGVRKWVEDLVNERTVVGEKNWRESAGRSTDRA